LVVGQSENSQEELLEYWRTSMEVGNMLSQAGWLDRKRSSISKTIMEQQRNDLVHSTATRKRE
ncbi:hypothetical protein, partial [Pseudomonas sp. 51_B]